MERRTSQAIKGVSLLFALAAVGAGVYSGLGQSLAIERTQGYQVAADGVTRVELHVDSGDVRIMGADGMQVSSSSRWAFSKPQIHVERSGQVLRVTSECSSWENACSVQWRLVVPAGVAVSIVSDVGDVSVSDVSAPLTIRADVGDLTILGSAGPVDAQVDVGDLSVETTDPSASVAAIADTGDVQVTVPAEGFYAVTATTDVGKTTTQYPAAADGGGTPVIARTDVGDVTVLSN